MSSIINMLNSVEDDGRTLVILVPLLAVVVAVVTLLIKFSFSKPQVTKKTQNSAKKQQKSHTAQNSDKKEEKINSEKKDKVSKENKSSSVNKSLEKQAGSEAAKSIKKQQNAVDEKVSKKNSAQTKKHQVNSNVHTKTNASSMKNEGRNNGKLQQAVDIFVTKEEGEWQMVTTKKQKQMKQEEKAEITTTPTNANKKAQKSLEKANNNKQPNNKTKKAKGATEKSDNSTKLIMSEIKPEEIQACKEDIKTTIENNLSAELDLSSNSTKNTSVNNNDAIIVEETTPIANVAFDEFGDDGWTDTKPQKKNRKRALRE